MSIARSQTRLVAVLLFPNCEPLDVFGPVEAFVIAEWPGAKPEDPRPFRVVTVAQALAPIAMRGGTRILPDHDFAGCPPLDVLLVPGGPGTRVEYQNHELLNFIAARAPSVEVLGSVCTGAALLSNAGVLSGHEATTNRRPHDHPTAKLVSILIHNLLRVEARLAFLLAVKA